MADMMGSALSALTSYQRALATTSHNIANANTDGYSRQNVNMAARMATNTAIGAIGSGVEVTSIRRAYDQFAVDQLRTSTSGLFREQTFAGLATQVESVVSDPVTGINSALGRFFNAAQDVATDPSSLSARRVLIGEGQALATRLNDIDSQLEAIDQDVDARMRASVDEINEYAKRIAQLNQAIVDAQASMTSGSPNDLMDARDQALLGLNELVKVSTVPQNDGAVNVFIGSGQSLVLSTTPQKLTITPNAFNPTKPDISLSNGGVITSTLNGGSLGGLLEFRDEVLTPTRNQVGIIALAVATQVNAVQTAGRDLTGAAGVDFFSVPGPQALPSTLNTGTGSVTASISDLGKLQPDNYRLIADGAGGFSLFTEPGGQAVNAADVGLSISLGGAAAAGDTFMIRPAGKAASDIRVNLTQSTQIAAASGSGVFGPGDNSNALALVGVENSKVLFNGTVSLAEGVQNLISEVASQVRSAEIATTAQNQLVEQAMSRRDAVSGVNLDEEAANLMKYQQAYQAAAQIASTANTIFQTIIDTFRR